MHSLYIATVFAGALVCLVASLLLFACRKAGERSRIILAVIVLFSVFNYIPRFIALCNGEMPELVVSTKLLLQANFMLLAYIMYPIEVIAPGWLSFWRILKLYSLWFLLWGVYLVSLWAGVEYTPYMSITDMFVHAGRFEVWFRLLLCVFFFSPVLFVFFIHRTRIYHNSDRIWMRKYVVTLTINILAYLLVLMFNHPIINICYYYVSVGCSLYIAYMELFDRLIAKSRIEPTIEAKLSPLREVELESEVVYSLPLADVVEQKDSALIERLDAYVKKNRAWRDPDLSLNILSSKLYTNRTTLAQAMRENGYGSYTNYINKLRIDDFLEQIESGQSANFQEAFFFVGFRSRGTALRNFRQFAGMPPSEYFQKKNIPIEVPME
jgi:AraC-like DNA-binding protein